MLKFDDDVEYKSPFIQRLPLRGRQNKKIGAGRALFTNEKLQFFFGASSADFIKVHGLAKELGLLREQATCALRAPFVEDGPTQQNAKEMQSKRNTLNGNALREYHLYDTYMRLVESAFIYVGTLLGDAWSYGPVKRLLTLQKRAQFGQTIARAEYIRHFTSCMTLYKTLYVVRRLRSLCAHRRTTAAHKEWLKILWNYLRIFWQLRTYMRFINDGGRRQYKGR